MGRDKITKIKNLISNKEFSRQYFEQYKLYLDGIEKISDRRESANKYFVTLNSGIIVTISFLLQHIYSFFFIPAMTILLLLGVILSTIFFILISSYRQLNHQKFNILHKMEKNLPAKMYTEEWKALDQGKNLKKYIPFSYIECLIPFVFLCIYIIALVCLIYYQIIKLEM